MKRLSFLAVIVWLFLPAAALAQSQQTTDAELIRGANQQLAAHRSARHQRDGQDLGARDLRLVYRAAQHDGRGRLGRRAPGLANAVWLVRSCHHFHG